MPVDETQEDLEDQQPHLRILVQREGKQRLQERAGQSCQHVGGLETCRHLVGTVRVQRKKEMKQFARNQGKYAYIIPCINTSIVLYFLPTDIYRTIYIKALYTNILYLFFIGFIVFF